MGYLGTQVSPSRLWCIPRHPPTHPIVTQCDLRQWPTFFVWKKNVEVVLRKLTGDTPEALPSARQTVTPSPDLAA
jgi:hypothetical protein